jgi:ribosomal protein L32
MCTTVCGTYVTNRHLVLLDMRSRSKRKQRTDRLTALQLQVGAGCRIFLGAPLRQGRLCLECLATREKAFRCK